jgi:N-acetylmuramoyl-L-alanine amidase
LAGTNLALKSAMLKAGLLLLLLLPITASATQFKLVPDWSPKNPVRPEMSQVRYIILHTTEGDVRGALAKLWTNGEAHYLIDRDGTVYQLMDTDRMAKHTGRSLWNGDYNLDRESLGIEVVGYHNVYPTSEQIHSLAYLLRNLKHEFHVSDDRILPHSMVAYGVPNLWYASSHRGRKACGMLFAAVDLRRQLGLRGKPEFDPDVAARRLSIGDLLLAHFLFGDSTSASTNYPSEMPEESDDMFHEVTNNNQSAFRIAGAQFSKFTTIYFFPNGKIKTGYRLVQTPDGRKLLDRLPRGTRLLIGYIDGGPIAPKRPPHLVAADAWDDPATYYLLPNGNFLSGDQLDSEDVPSGTRIFYQD